jgi:cytochrome P450
LLSLFLPHLLLLFDPFFLSYFQVISEGLRLRPIVGNAFKVATEDTTLYGYRVPKGWSVNLDYRAVMCRDSYFPEADQFRPERFDVRERNERIGGKYNPQIVCANSNSVAVTDLCTPLCALFL